MKKLAFTLSEVLITLGIIGIIIAMTLPSLITRYNKKQTVVRLKKAYSTLANAYRLAQYEYGDKFRKDIDWTKNTARVEFLEKLRPFLDIAVDCDKGSANICFPKHNDRNGAFYYTHLEKKGSTFFGANKNSAVILKDGTLIVILDSPHSNMHAVAIMVDINGTAKPNHYGHDTFFFYIEDSTNNQLAGKRVIQKDSSCQYNSTSQAQACADWILKNDNMDYL